MSKARLFMPLAAIVGLHVLAGGVGAWAFPLRAPVQAAPVNSQPESKQIRVETVIKPLEEAPVAYPARAEFDGIQGKVRLRVAINRDGSVMGIWVLSGPPMLVKAAIESVQRWRYAASNMERVTIVNIVFAHPGADAPLTTPHLEPVSRVPPVYPPEAKAAHIQGTVKLVVLVDRNGRVDDIRVLSGPPLLVKAALSAVAQWRYSPREEAALTDVAVNFPPP